MVVLVLVFDKSRLARQGVGFYASRYRIERTSERCGGGLGFSEWIEEDEDVVFGVVGAAGGLVFTAEDAEFVSLSGDVAYGNAVKNPLAALM